MYLLKNVMWCNQRLIVPFLWIIDISCIFIYRSLWLVSSVLLQHTSSSSTHSVINRKHIRLGSIVTMLITLVVLMRGVAIVGVVMSALKKSAAVIVSGLSHGAFSTLPSCQFALHIWSDTSHTLQSVLVQVLATIINYRGGRPLF